MRQHKPRRGLAAERGSTKQGREVGKCGQRWFNQVGRESHAGQNSAREPGRKESVRNWSAARAEGSRVGAGGGDGEPGSLGSSRNTRATQQAMTQVGYRPDGGMGAEGHSGELRHWGRGVPSVDRPTQGTGFAAKMTSPVGGVHSLSNSVWHRRRTRRGGVSPLIRRGVSFNLQRRSQ